VAEALTKPLGGASDGNARVTEKVADPEESVVMFELPITSGRVPRNSEPVPAQAVPRKNWTSIFALGGPVSVPAIVTLAAAGRIAAELSSVGGPLDAPVSFGAAS
jgi:hypothetical protein